MIRITNTEVFGFRSALRAMRNPMESWDRSDTVFGHVPTSGVTEELDKIHEAAFYAFDSYNVPERPYIGPNDLKLLTNLSSVPFEEGGAAHRKCLHNIEIWATIEPNRAVWQEIDTYKVHPTRNSCSTMHKGGHRDLTPADFADEDVDLDYLEKLNVLGRLYRDGGKKNFDLVIRLKRRLPEGFLQRADYHMNYENALNMFFQRRNHRLPEWRYTGATVPDGQGRMSICDWIATLPYMPELIKAVEDGRKLPDLSDALADAHGKGQESALAEVVQYLEERKKVLQGFGDSVVSDVCTEEIQTLINNIRTGNFPPAEKPND